MVSGERLFSREMLIDPYPTYRRLREESPVHHDAQSGGWVLRAGTNAATGVGRAAGFRWC